MAMERVERQLRRVTAALDDAEVPYAVCGGNAVATWVASQNPEATRATKDVDLLVDRADLKRVQAVIEGLGYTREDLRSLVLFLDPEAPDRRTGVHLVWADELIRPSYPVKSPRVEEADPGVAAYRVLGLPALLRMKLTSMRPIDQAHVLDLHSVGLVDNAIMDSLPRVLRERLDELLEQHGDELWP